MFDIRANTRINDTPTIGTVGEFQVGGRTCTWPWAVHIDSIDNHVLSFDFEGHMVENDQKVKGYYSFPRQPIGNKVGWIDFV